MRIEFSVRVRKAAWDRSRGICECGCGQPFTAADPVDYHHRIEASLGGDATLENCIALRRSCHRIETIARAPFIAKATRLERKARGITAKKHSLPGGRNSPWKMKIGGGVVRRSEE